MNIWRMSAAACLIVALVGCGQKGPLLLPDAAARKHKHVAPGGGSAAAGSPAAGAPAPTPGNTPPSSPAPATAVPPGGAPAGTPSPSNPSVPDPIGLPPDTTPQL